MALYLYGFVRRPAGEAQLGTGVGAPPQPVRLLVHRDVAAIVSDVPADEPESEGRALRRDMRSHNEVLVRAMALGTVLPLTFGTVAADEASAVEQILGAHYRHLDELLEQFAGTVEVTLKLRYDEDRIVQAVLGSDPELAEWSRHVPSAGYEDRIAFGQSIAAGIHARRDVDGQRVVGRLQPLARDLRVTAPRGELELLNASFLVDGTSLAAFDETVENVTAELNTLSQVDYLGPLPPYSFVSLPWRGGNGGS